MHTHMRTRTNVHHINPTRLLQVEEEPEVVAVTSGFERMFGTKPKSAAKGGKSDASKEMNEALQFGNGGVVAENAALGNVLSSPSHVIID